MGYSAMDIIQTLFRVVKNDPKMPEFLKLEFIRVRLATRVSCLVAGLSSELYFWQSFACVLCR